MGRELRRVPMDFNWPLNQIWKGYLNPYARHECKTCGGSGMGPGKKELEDTFYDHEGNGLRRWCDKITQAEVDHLIEHGRLRHWAGHANGGWISVPRTAEEVNAANRRGANMLGELAHDGINRWRLVDFRAKAMGVDAECPVCHGSGELFCDDRFAELRDEWEFIEPPTGPGFQLWETTSEGSPVSPVFETLDALCEWCAKGATTFGSERATAAQWKGMLGEKGLVCHKEGNAVFL